MRRGCSTQRFFDDLMLLSGIANECGLAGRVSASMRKLCKNIVGDMFSCLDYVASGVWKLTGAAEGPRVSFPVTPAASAAKEYSHRFDSALPGVRSALPSIYEAIRGEQAFFDGGGHPWLPVILALNNRAKHRRFLSAKLQIWLHVGLESEGSELHIFTEQMELGIGSKIQAGRLLIEGPGSFDADHLPSASGVGKATIERVVDFELIATGSPVEWTLLDLYL